jgi:hypothetical protein
MCWRRGEIRGACKYCQRYLVCLSSKQSFSGAYAAIVSFLLFSTIQFRDGPFIRPHPAIWRVVLGINLLYELGLVFLLFQDLGSARKMMTLIDPALGVPLPEKNYAEDCTLTPRTIWVGLSCVSSEYIMTHELSK